MKAMILAAGRGERMRPLTDSTPKPLLPVAGKPMLQYTIEALVKSGFDNIVINLAYRGQQVKDALGEGSQFSAHIDYSEEGETGLETAGGIIHALPLLGTEPFLVVNGDVASDFDFAKLYNKPIDMAHLVLVNNPAHHADGDFGLQHDRVLASAAQQFTFSGIGLYRPELFAQTQPGKSKLAPLLRQAMQQGKVSGEHHPGFWMDIGTPERLKELENYYQTMR